MKMIEAFKEEMNKCKKIQENTIKQVKEINTTVQDLKVEMCLCSSCIKCVEIF
jgi:bacterioferritin-associated ferredoxin